MTYLHILWHRMLRDLLVHTLLGLAAVTLLIVVGNVLRFLEDVASADVGLSAIGELTAAVLPTFASYSIPMALIFGVLISLGRMASDGETLALQASGISPRQLLPPVLVLGLAASVATGYLMAETGPRSYARMKQLVRDLARNAVLLDPGEFREIGGHVLFYRSRGEPPCLMRGVVVTGLGSGSDRDMLTTGECGGFVDDRNDRQLTFELRRGSIHFGRNREERYRRIRFDSMRLPLDISGRLAERHWPREYTTPELIALEPVAGAKSDEWRLLLWIQLHRRIAFPLGSLVLVLVAFPLGLRPIRAGRSAGVLTALAVVVGYWVVSDAGETLAETSAVPAVVGIWAPDLLFLALGVALMYRASRAQG